MDTGLIKSRGIYAVGTLKETAVLSFKQFFPLLAGWAISLGGPVLMIALAGFAGGMLDHFMLHARGPSIFTLIGLLTGGALIGGFYAGWILITLKVARRLPARWSDIFRPLPQIINCGIVLVITTVCMGLLSFLVIASPLLFLKWQLAPYYVIDRGYGPIQALRQSWHDTDRMFAPLAIADLLIYGAMILSTPTFIGPILCHMLSGVLSAIVYNRWLTDDDNPEFAQLSNNDYVN